MQIRETGRDNGTQLQIEGRIDSHWSPQLETHLEELVRQGCHRIQLDLRNVSFLSSAGIRVLLRFYKQLAAVDGALVIVHPSDFVKKVLDASGLTALMQTGPAAAPKPKRDDLERIKRSGVVFEVYPPATETQLTCRCLGDPASLVSADRGAERVELAEDSFGLGIGACGSDYEDCRHLFGEFLAAGGAVTYQPAETGAVPDYMLPVGSFSPEVLAHSATMLEGAFSRFLRFETGHDARGAALPDLVQTALDTAGSPRIGLVMLAESAGLIGAAVKRSPALLDTDQDPFDYPYVRRWLSFTPERIHTRCLCLVVGVAAAEEPGELAHAIRPLGDEPWPQGHFHAASFSFRPIPPGAPPLRDTVLSLFESETLRGVLHLLHDGRTDVGGGDSEFTRGAIWYGGLA
jgi:anti-anti-sigma factor